MIQFTKATKKQSKLRMALIGPSGSGKTYTALKVGTGLGGKIAVIDTERGSASKYADLFEFDTLNLETFSPLTYVEAIKAADAAGYDVLVIDSLSHAWMGKEGALEQVDKAAKRSQSGNSYTAWRDVTPMHNALIDAMLQSRCHIIGTMRTKTEYVIEQNERGKSVPKKIGLAPVQRDGLEYEFDVVGDMDAENNFVVSKTRCPALAGAVIQKPGQEVADTLKAWLSDGEPASEQKPEPGGMVATLQELGAEVTHAEPVRMDLETALNVKNSEGVYYGTIESEKLSSMTIGIGKALAKKGITQEERETYQFKMDAIAAILASRAEAEHEYTA